MNRHGLFVATVVLAIVGCDRGVTPALLTVPTIVPPPPAPPPGSTDAIRVVVGQRLDAVVTLQNFPCNSSVMTDAPDPCQRFVLDAPVDGYLTITVGWPRTGTWLVLRVNGAVIGYGTDSLSHRLFVHAAESVTFSVGLHAGSTAQAFQIITDLASTGGPPDLVLTPGGALGATITTADLFVGEDDLVGRCHHIPCRIVSVESPAVGYIDIRLWWDNTSSALALYVPTSYAQSERYCCQPSRPVPVAVRSGRNVFVVGFENAGPPPRTASEYFQIETSEVRATR
jgi:hypothetical protein